jgi:hypothetical protein
MRIRPAALAAATARSTPGAAHDPVGEEAQRTQGVEDARHRVEGMRRPDRVDVHRVPAAGVADVAVAPALRRPAPRIAWRERDEIRGVGTLRVRGSELGEQRELAQHPH